MHEWLIEIGSWIIAFGITGLALIGLLVVMAKICELFMGGSK
jgi:hypothetical protein